MLALQANEEQEQTFQKLIQTMGEQVVWNGRFIVRDDELILEGTVRSLIFQFETKQVTTNLVDLPVKEEQVLDISRHPTIKDLINMVLYAFGKWGMLRGLHVQQDYPQLNQLFAKILNTFYIEPSFRKENFRFYKVGMRITYEEVLQTVLEYEKKQEDDPRAESQGLWHRLIWRNRERSFQKTETTLLERAEERIGNNFYLVGYHCPKCSSKLHMVVYPDGKEVRIDTEEKGVYLARAYTCSRCFCFYTPRPERLISEGLIYEMDFGNDPKAYEDYLELLGYYGERAANFKYNEYEAVRRQRLLQEAKEKREGLRPKSPDRFFSPQDALRQMEEFGQNISRLSDEVLRRFAHRVEEGFYPDTAVAKYEKKILEEIRVRDSRGNEAPDHAKKPQTENADDRKPKAQEWDPDTLDMELDDMGQVQYHAEGALDHTLNHTAGQKPYTSGTMPGSQKQRSEAANTEEIPRQQINAGKSPKMNVQPADAWNLSKSAERHAHAGNPSEHSNQNTYAHDPTEHNGHQPQAEKEKPSRSAGQMAYTTTLPKSDEQKKPEQKQFAGQTSKDDSQRQTGQPHNVGRQDEKKPSNAPAQPTISHAHTRQAASGSTKDAVAEKVERYEKRIQMLERLSARQRQELKKQLENDPEIDEAQRKAFTGQITQVEFREKTDAIRKKTEQSAGRSYAQIQRVIQETEAEQMPQELKEPFLEKLQQMRTQRGEEEVRQIIAQIPQRMDRAGYQKLEKQLQAYGDVDLSPYHETLRRTREAAEKQEIAGMVKRARKVSRSDYTGLMRRLEEQAFADEAVAPYLEKIEEKVRSMDEQRLEELLDKAPQMDFQTAAAVYEQINAESFLPELKSGALEMLSKRLEKIRTDECELLVKKLQDEMQHTIKENARHHFYPARKVMLGTAKPEEINAVNAALSAYANERSMFEYPIFSVDTSRSCSGREGMLLTPETLFYSTRSHAYEIPVSSIASIEASTGLLNRKITLFETNGAEHKLPYAVKTNEMEDWAGILEGFIQYLQQKPASRKLNYLAKETHDTICCYRCGYVYHGRDVCPECGYKKNR